MKYSLNLITKNEWESAVLRAFDSHLYINKDIGGIKSLILSVYKCII